MTIDDTEGSCIFCKMGIIVYVDALKYSDFMEDSLITSDEAWEASKTKGICSLCIKLN